jgi:hypothetical protein
MKQYPNEAAELFLAAKKNAQWRYITTNVWLNKSGKSKYRQNPDSGDNKKKRWSDDHRFFISFECLILHLDLELW